MGQAGIAGPAFRTAGANPAGRSGERAGAMAGADASREGAGGDRAGEASGAAGGPVARRRHDILAGLAAHALAAPASGQRRALRLIALLTARYNWQADRLAIGREEIARLWAVDPRTVRREMGRLRADGWLEIRRPAARGRVAVYGLGLPALMRDLAPALVRLGPDFVARAGALVPGQPDPDAAGPARILPFPRPGDARPEGWGAEGGDAEGWGRIRARLGAAEPDLARAWFDRLVPEPGPPGTLVLRAPSGFVARYVETHLWALLAAARDAAAPEIAGLQLLGPGGPDGAG